MLEFMLCMMQLIISPNKWIYKKYFAHKHYVPLMASRPGIKNLNFLKKMWDEAVDHEKDL